jgi:hypothetical protein
MTTDATIQQRRNDQKDMSQLNELEESINQVDKKFSVLHVCVKDYRDKLASANQFYKLYEDVECMTQQKIQLIEQYKIRRTQIVEIKEVETIIQQLTHHIEDFKQSYETKINQLSKLAVQIYGTSIVLIVFQLEFTTKRSNLR